MEGYRIPAEQIRLNNLSQHVEYSGLTAYGLLCCTAAWCKLRRLAYGSAFCEPKPQLRSDQTCGSFLGLRPLHGGFVLRRRGCAPPVAALHRFEGQRLFGSL